MRKTKAKLRLLDLLWILLYNKQYNKIHNKSKHCSSDLQAL